VYLKRAGAQASAGVILACGEAWNQGFVAVHTLSNAFYLIEKQRTRAEAWEFIRDVLGWALVAEVSTVDAMRTQRMGTEDFEDALQIAAVERCGADVIVTRNVKDFAGKTSVRVVQPEDFNAPLAV
jgi:hypothetical protein